ncbi:bromodomain-containing protein 8 [Mytilus galloprovincialis]|uniref:Bromodomain-containing protein 8 n=2 Tax=Mytilus TaxID=6548 RepID=A0A8B6EDD0_MYTGA|nr:bromodomain-containing protein 8 [Mytilus galloprovincialis]
MAVEMYDDVMTHIEQYVSAQLMLQSSESKSLRPSRRTESSDKSDKEDDSKRRRTFSESHQEGGKSKKRKTRGDDT